MSLLAKGNRALQPRLLTRVKPPSSISRKSMLGRGLHRSGEPDMLPPRAALTEPQCSSLNLKASIARSRLSRTPSPCLLPRCFLRPPRALVAALAICSAGNVRSPFTFAACSCAVILVKILRFFLLFFVAIQINVSCNIANRFSANRTGSASERIEPEWGIYVSTCTCCS